jgi:hypothetical protein
MISREPRTQAWGSALRPRATLTPILGIFSSKINSELLFPAHSMEALFELAPKSHLYDKKTFIGRTPARLQKPRGRPCG